MWLKHLYWLSIDNDQIDCECLYYVLLNFNGSLLIIWKSFGKWFPWRRDKFPILSVMKSSYLISLQRRCSASIVNGVKIPQCNYNQVATEDIQNVLDQVLNLVGWLLQYFSNRLLIHLILSKKGLRRLIYSPMVFSLLVTNVWMKIAMFWTDYNGFLSKENWFWQQIGYSPCGIFYKHVLRVSSRYELPSCKHFHNNF